MKGLALAESPPLWLPVSFLLVAPAAMVAGGALLAAQGPLALSSSWGPATLALTHLGTLGLLASAMFGALYQLVPVVAARRVPALTMAGVVQPLWVVGTAALVWGLLGGPRAALVLAIGALGVAVSVFVASVGGALSRPGPAGPTVDGMRLALVALVGVVALGLTMATRLASGHVGADRAVWLQAHLVFGLLGWVGMLLAAVQWRVIPMFQLAPDLPLRLRQGVVVAVGVGLVLCLGLLAVGSRYVAFGAAPAAVALWVVMPVATLRALASRRRPGRDAGLLAWRLSMGCGLATGAAALAALTVSDPRLPLVFGWLAIWGWAGIAVHGMLTRIVPFLVWYHRCSGHLGAPSMRSLLPDGRARAGVAVHAVTLATGLAAIVTTSPTLAHGTGLLLLATGVWLGGSLVTVLLPFEVPHAA